MLPLSETFTQLVLICDGIAAIAGAVVLLVRPVRERVLGKKQSTDGLRCLLRSDMMRTYYKNHEGNTIRQYEYENFLMEYAAYKALGGNSFIDRVQEEVKTWEVLS